MGERGVFSNEAGGRIDGSVVQAGIVHGDVSVTAPVRVINRVSNEIRSFKMVGVLFRSLASIAGGAAVFGLSNGCTPLVQVASWCKALAIPGGWTVAAAEWISGRAEVVATVAEFVVVIGLLLLPRPRQLGWDFGESLEWRGPSTVVLAMAVVVQCGSVWPAMLNAVVIAAVGLWIAGQGRTSGYARWEYVTVAASAIFLALLFLPVYLFAVFFGRDVRAGGHP